MYSQLIFTHVSRIATSSLAENIFEHYAKSFIPEQPLRMSNSEQRTKPRLVADRFLPSTKNSKKNGLSNPVSVYSLSRSGSLSVAVEDQNSVEKVKEMSFIPSGVMNALREKKLKNKK